MKKIISLVLIFVLAFASLTANANALNENLNVFVDKLSEFSSADRKNLLTVVYPMISIDGGVDILVSMIESHKSASDSLVDEYIAELLKYTTKEKLKFSLESIKIVPKDIRKAYIQDYMDGVEKTLSEDNLHRMNALMDKVYEKSPKLEKIFQEDNITSGTIAHQLTMFNKMNDSVPMFSADCDYVFKNHYISKNITETWDTICKNNNVDISLNDKVSGVTDYLNKEYSKEYRQNIAILLSELGICYIDESGNLVFKNTVSAGSGKVAYPVIYISVDNGKLTYKVETLTKDISNVSFSDINGWYKSCVTELAYMGIVSGRGDGRFYPNDYVTREEFVKMICAAMNLPETDADVPFNDVGNDKWYYSYIRDAYNNKLINGQSAESFGVGQNISRQDVAVICNNLLKHFNIESVNKFAFGDMERISPYAVESVRKLASYGIINGDDKGMFNPRNSITRAESAKIVNEIIYLIANLK